jgi:hypothetical protein
MMEIIIPLPLFGHTHVPPINLTDGDIYFLLHIFDQILPHFCNFEYEFDTFVLN